MEAYKREFIKFLEGAGVLKFGDFTAKSGRKIPYFINAGDIKTGEQISKLGEFYARAYLEKVGKVAKKLVARHLRFDLAKYFFVIMRHICTAIHMYLYSYDSTFTCICQWGFGKYLKNTAYYDT